MRVISGSAKGIRLAPVPGTGTRPIADRVKESLFNILGDHVINAQVLDLFAGTGGVGIESLSRGAARAVFVEKAPKALATIRANLRRTRLIARARVQPGDVFKFLKEPPEPFDLIYVAPPQYLGLWSKALRLLDATPQWLNRDGLVVVQIFPKEYQSLELESLQLVDQRKYGSTLLCFFERGYPSEA
jgi:16S rRNA (guanine(966)-N(2))-methyltransferase RsmD